MHKSIIYIFLVGVLIIENLIVIFVYSQYKQLEIAQIKREKLIPLVDSCKLLEIGEQMYTSVSKLSGTSALITGNEKAVKIYYGTSLFNGTGITLIFDSNSKLIFKSCDAKWMPDAPPANL
jgi:hypothetical protein